MVVFRSVLLCNIGCSFCFLSFCLPALATGQGWHPAVTTARSGNVCFLPSELPCPALRARGMPQQESPALACGGSPASPNKSPGALCRKGVALLFRPHTFAAPRNEYRLPSTRQLLPSEQPGPSNFLAPLLRCRKSRQRSFPLCPPTRT